MSRELVRMCVGDPVRLLLISGSTRNGSTNTAALRTLHAIAGDDVTTVVYEGLTRLPAFIPDSDGDPHPAVTDLRRQLTEADAVVFCTPEYAGTLPGSLKNLIDWTVGTGELYGKPVAWINIANPDRGEGAIATLVTVLGYVAATVIEPACVRIPISRDAVNADGLVADQAVHDALRRSCQEIVAFLRTVRAEASAF